ncbi:MAG: hypothetical protein DBX55_07070 [Verrucomicrobia bacterium]|nr:MAG: hypothetical protein DBX55_07070 [Verrucomicrobiota bacterium]
MRKYFRLFAISFLLIDSFCSSSVFLLALHFARSARERPASFFIFAQITKLRAALEISTRSVRADILP